ncbi:hypothetical protein CR513_29490, partial [Mucuna pruriens]
MFHGLASEDPHKHLKEFHVICSTIRPHGIPEDYIKMKAFPFSMDGAVKDWLYMGDMKMMFLEKFFLAFMATSIKKEICDIRQHSGQHYMSTRRDSTSCVELVLITKSVSSSWSNTFVRG